MRKIIFDIETYPNIILFGFKEVGANNPDFVHFSNKKASIINELKTLFERYGTHTLVGYNSRRFDDIIINYALRGATVEGLYCIAQKLIEGRYVKPISGITSIDLKAIAGTHFKLKAVGCRLGYHTIDELPFNPLEPCPDIDRLREYLTHDLNLTEQLYLEMEQTVESRLLMGVRSALNRRTPELGTELLLSQIKQQSSSGWVVKPAPDYERIAVEKIISKNNELKNPVLNELSSLVLHVVKDEETSKPDYNKWNTKTKIGETEYSVGFGGLHSTRKNYHETDLVDVDVSSYYPTLIRNLNIVPRNLRGSAFIETITEMLNTRLEAKKNPDRKSEAAIAKLVLNSTFGKFGYHRERYLFDISAMLAVTLNGQLILIELIEQLEAAGYPVITANTDGVTFRKSRGNYQSILRAFEQKWNMVFEETHIKQLVGLDINNYFLIDEHGKIKGRGLFDVFRSFDENKAKQINRIIPQSIVEYYTHGTEPESFVKQKQHAFTDYINWSSLKVPALWGEECYTDFTGWGGRVLRWYRSTDDLPPIILKRAKGDARLPLSERCRIVLTLPDNRPDDIDYDWYAGEAWKWINTIEGQGISTKPITPDNMLAIFAGSGSTAFTKVQQIVSGLKSSGYKDNEILQLFEHNILSVIQDDGEYERILHNLIK